MNLSSERDESNQCLVRKQPNRSLDRRSRKTKLLVDHARVKHEKERCSRRTIGSIGKSVLERGVVSVELVREVGL
ncbi:hypothetical protein Bca52824_087849 [Brassica carinata]|uniref:Uncharacterized protein n=1 Tax=Brassica carinata TaxID=52824 RepID=A0A8X7TP23_BRACI|nr:hypothetical protein Bca52824_087849 [Brassica carinata]